MRLIKIFARVLAAIAIFAALLFISAFSYFRYEAHVAKQMIQDLQKLEVGKSTAADVKPLVARYHAVEWDPEKSGRPCAPDNCTYVFLVTTYPSSGRSTFVNRMSGAFESAITSESVQYLGFRGWFASASVTLANGRVKSYGGDITVRAACQKLLGAYFSVADEFPPLGHHGERWPNVISENLLIMGRSLISDESGEAIEAYLRPSATAEERQAAFNLNMACLTRMGNGCFLLSDILPDGARWQQQHGHWPVISTAHACRGLKDPDLR